MPTTILTGLPRSGTTLLCLLLNAAPDTIAMAEPMTNQGEQTADQLFAGVPPFIDAARRTALEQRIFLSQTVDGQLTDNFLVAPAVGSPEMRQSRATRTEVAIDKPLSTDFSLFIKHPDRFSAIVPQLVATFPVFALVRHPLAVLASWQTADMAVYHGRMPWCELTFPDLAERLDAIPDRIPRQVEILRFLFDLYERHVGSDGIVRYEDILADPARELLRMGVDGSDVSTVSIDRRPWQQRYAALDLPGLERYLMDAKPSFERLYPEWDAALD